MISALKKWTVDDTGAVLAIVYHLGSIATFVKLTFFDGYDYNWWNWIIAIPINLFLGEIWPIYWLILRPFFGS